MQNKEKPESWYKEISSPYDRKEEIKLLFKDYKIIEHNNSEPDYSYLYDSEFSLEIVNPNGGENLFVEFDGCFTLYFGDWHTHYETYEYDYGLMIKDATEIINGSYCTVCLYIDGEWKLSILSEEKIFACSDPMEVLKKTKCEEYYSKYYKQDRVVMGVTYWQPKDNCKFTIEPQKNKNC